MLVVVLMLIWLLGHRMLMSIVGRVHENRRQLVRTKSRKPSASSLHWRVSRPSRLGPTIFGSETHRTVPRIVDVVTALSIRAG